MHYVDVMCQITDAQPGARPRHGPAPQQTRSLADMYNYGQLQVAFRGWFGRLVRGRLGPDDVGDRLLCEGRRHRPNGCRFDHRWQQEAPLTTSMAIPRSVRALGASVLGSDTALLEMPDEPGHQQLCDAEQSVHRCRPSPSDIRPDPAHVRRRPVAPHLPRRG